MMSDDLVINIRDRSAYFEKRLARLNFLQQGFQNTQHFLKTTSVHPFDGGCGFGSLNLFGTVCTEFLQSFFKLFDPLYSGPSHFCLSRPVSVFTVSFPLSFSLLDVDLVLSASFESRVTLSLEFSVNIQNCPAC